MESKIIFSKTKKIANFLDSDLYVVAGWVLGTHKFKLMGFLITDEDKEDFPTSFIRKKTKHHTEKIKEKMLNELKEENMKNE